MYNHRLLRVPTYSELLERLGLCSQIVIVGISGSGKTTLGLQLADDLELPLYCCDSYIKTGRSYSEELYALIEDIESGPDKWIIEGVQGYRFLRKASPKWVDAVVHLGTNKKIPIDYVPTAKGLFKIWTEYLRQRREAPIYNYDFDYVPA